MVDGMVPRGAAARSGVPGEGRSPASLPGPPGSVVSGEPLPGGSHRPDAFRKVISTIGSYTSIGYHPARDGKPAISGGEIYPTLIRRERAKPIRIFLQDGTNDLSNSEPNGVFPDRITLSNQFGNWHLANQQMLSAFEYANRVAPAGGPRYDVAHEWGDGAHSGDHGGAILPNILRWMWRDFPK